MAIELGSMSDNIVQILNLVFWDAVRFAPNVLIAIILILIGFFVSGLVGKVISKILEYLKVEKIMKKYKVEGALGGSEICPILATAAKWYAMLLFLTAAVEYLNISSISWIAVSALMFAPVLIGVGLLVIVAAIIGEWVREAILGMHKFYLQRTIAEVLKWFIVLMAVMVSLETIGFHMSFVRDAFNILLQGAVYGIAIAFGLAFGLGGQKEAQDIIKHVRKLVKI